MIEALHRDQQTTLYQWELEMVARGVFAGGKPKEVQATVTKMSESLRARMSGEVYSFRHLAARLRAELGTLRDAQKRLKKIDAMTVGNG